MTTIHIPDDFTFVPQGSLVFTKESATENQSSQTPDRQLSTADLDWRDRCGGAAA